jgi:hypothetical protein
VLPRCDLGCLAVVMVCGVVLSVSFERNDQRGISRPQEPLEHAHSLTHVASGLGAGPGLLLSEPQRYVSLAQCDGFFGLAVGAQQFHRLLRGAQAFIAALVVAGGIGIHLQRQRSIVATAIGSLSEILACLQRVLRGLFERIPMGAWMTALETRAPRNVLIVAAANKLARIAWAVLSSGQDYRAVQDPVAA